MRTSLTDRGCGGRTSSLTGWSESGRRSNCAVTWLDEPIPALSGHTPRQCAEDPTRRPDLIRLLDSFPPDTGAPGLMSPERLRSALGLG